MRNLCNRRICSKSALTLLCAALCIAPLRARNYFFPYSNVLQWDSKAKCLSHDQPVIPQFEMLELGFELPGEIDALTEQPNRKLNPFDPDDVSVTAVFSNGNRSDTVFGFYYRDYVRDPAAIKTVYDNFPQAKWNEEFTQYKWRVRFSPPDTGAWTASIKVQLGTLPALTYSIDAFAFKVVSSTHGGFLALGNDKLHFIESGTKRSFFMLGQDIAWPDGERFRGSVSPQFPAMTAGGYMDIIDWAADLRYSGGNTIRVVNVPWSYEFEWDTVGVYDMEHAWELDALFAGCEKSNIRIVFCMEHGSYTLYPWYEEHLNWDKHPYNRFLPTVNYPQDFLTDSLARAQYKKKLRYFFARWGYSSSLGIFQILSEMDNWTFKDGEQLEDSKALQQMNLAWHTEMLAYAKSQVKYRSLLTSTSYGDAPRNFSVLAYSSPYVDVVCPRHCYFTQRHDNLKRWGEINGVSIAEPGIHDLFPDKAAIIDEMGFGSSSADPNDIDASNDVVYHNALWATAFSGTAGAGLYWWRWGSNEYRKQNFPALHNFFTGVDFESVHFLRPGHWEDAGRASKVSIETFYITTADAKRAHCMGWVHNASYWWGNISQNVKDRNGKTMQINSRTGDDAKISAPTELAQGTKFEVHDLANGNGYTLSWYNTRGAGGKSGHDEFRTNIFGTAKLPWRTGEADWGFKLDDINAQNPGVNVTLQNDTIQAGEVITAYGNHPSDDGTFTYHWDFGNGIASDERNAQVVYAAGAYSVTLICTDGAGKRFVMKQRMIVTDLPGNVFYFGGVPL